MKQKRLFAMAIVAVMAAGATSVTEAQAAGLSYGADAAMYSKYIWRGVEQSTGSAVQGDVSASIDGLSASAWFSNSYGGVNGFPVTEADFTLDYSGSYDKIGYDIGGLYYTYLNDSGSNFPEIYAGLSYDAVISPSVKVSYTPADSNSKYYKSGDTWIDLGLSGSIPGGVDLSGTVSFAEWKGDTSGPSPRDTNYWKKGAQLVTLSMSKDYSVSGITVTPSLMGTIPIVSDSPDGNKYIYGVQVEPEVIVGANFGF